MAITLQPVMLDHPFGDNQAMLGFRDGRLLAVLSCLGDLHEKLLGRWYVEAVFGETEVAMGQTFASLAELEVALANRSPSGRVLSDRVVPH